MKDILAFLTELSYNNNREWFNEHKDWYVRCQKQFELFTAQWLERLVEIDPEMKALTPKDCIWRIYRDVRFSHDKRPFKEWFGLSLPSKVVRKATEVAIMCICNLANVCLRVVYGAPTKICYTLCAVRYWQTMMKWKISLPTI